MPADALMLRRPGRGLSRFLRHQRWDLAIVRRSHADVLRHGLEGATIVPLGLSTAWSFAADPFGIDDGDRLHILYEHFDQIRRIGTIRAVTLNRDLAVVDHRPVFDALHHLAYPFLLRDADAVYCLCEQAQARRLVLMRAQALPDRWREAAVLLEGVAAVDATPVHHNGRWWLFATRADRGTANSELHLWWAEALTGPWHAHPGNPVKRDAGSARPAGTPLVLGGELWRPAQDCRDGYGGAVVLNRVTRLDEAGFAEETVARLGPPPGTGYPDGFHTLAPLGPDFCVIDIKREGFLPAALLGQLLALPGKALRRRQ